MLKTKQNQTTVDKPWKGPAPTLHSSGHWCRSRVFYSVGSKRLLLRLFSSLPSGEGRSMELHFLCFSFNCHSFVDSFIHLKTFFKYLCGRSHQHFLLGINNVRPGREEVGVELGVGKTERKWVVLNGRKLPANSQKQVWGGLQPADSSLTLTLNWVLGCNLPPLLLSSLTAPPPYLPLLWVQWKGWGYWVPFTLDFGQVTLLLQMVVSFSVKEGIWLDQFKASSLFQEASVQDLHMMLTGFSALLHNYFPRCKWYWT